MRTKPYYSVRTGKNLLTTHFDLAALRDLFRSLFIYFEDEGYFQEAFGYECVDAGFHPGTLGHDLEGALLLELRKRNLTPIRSRVDEYSEDDLFDVIEFLYDHCTKPVGRRFHDYGGCGWHCHTFEKESGQKEFRERVNKVLTLYEKGYELSIEGEILDLVPTGYEGLVVATLPKLNENNISNRVDVAITKFRRYRASIDERRDAIRDLADVLEYLRPDLKTVMNKGDESDLFNIVNNFGIRHHNNIQKISYDRSIWYSWMFYYYLATIHAVVRLIERESDKL